MKKTNQKGMTLIELSVAIAIVGLIIGVTVSQMGDWFDLRIKSTTKKLSSTIRYLHDKASTESLYMRLVFDFEKNTYWVEATSEQYMLTSKEVEAKDAEELQKEMEEEKSEEENTNVDAEAEGEDAESEGMSFAAPSVRKYRTPKFGAVDEFLLKPVSLPDGVFFKDIFTSHDNGPVSSGKAFIYIFPNGYIEPAIINLRDEDDEVVYSIEINPIIGSTKIRQEYRELETSDQ